jgi:hypothetical protein
MNQPKAAYYRAREDQTVNDLPIFFGHMELQSGKARGKHYRARIDRADKSYLIGYYWLDLDADEFFGKFQTHDVIEITETEFNTLLDKWTQGGKQAPFCWNPGENQEAELIWSTRADQQQA